MPIFLLLFQSQAAFAVPVQLTQQGRLIDSSGTSVNGAHALIFSLYDAQVGGSALWSEALSVGFNDGYYSVVLGDSSSNPLDDSILSQHPLYLQVEINNSGPVGVRQQVVSAPYARRSGTAVNLDGGVVDASSVSIDGQLVVDATGSWVGPAIQTDWTQILNVPSDLQDGDDDLLASISCVTNQLLSWDGVAWGCADDNSLTEADVEAFVTNGPLDFAAGSTLDGDLIVTLATDQDSLADLACQSGDIAKYDSVLGWQCDIDNDTSDWSGLQNIPAGFADGIDNDTSDWTALQNIPTDLADGDDVLTESQVEAFVSNGGIDLDPSTTINGQAILSANCPVGQILTSTGVGWDCSDLNSILDSDSDGVMAWEDCDDADVSAGSNVSDQDCDGIDSSLDCSDFDPNSSSISEDGDCDGILSVDDCDDGDPNSTSISEDGDCDGVLTANDCDDSDPASTTVSIDADCDGFLSGFDCDDFDSSLGEIGQNQDCAAQSCLSILQSNSSGSDGIYWIDPDGDGNVSDAFQAFCDMTRDGGGWTLVVQNNGGIIHDYTPTWVEATQTMVVMGGSLSQNLSDFDVWVGASFWNEIGSSLRLEHGNAHGQPDRSAFYDFSLDGSSYQLSLSNQQLVGTSTAPGIYDYHNGYYLSTYDNDNDYSSGNCATNYDNVPWWYGSCWDGNIWGYGSNQPGHWSGSGSDTSNWSAIWLR